MEDHIILGMALFDDSLEIDDQVLTILARYLDFALIGKIAKATCPNYRLTDSVSFIRWDFLTLSTARMTVA